MSVLGLHRARIRQGDSCIWITRPNTLANGASIDSNWKCYIGVFDSEGGVGVSIREVTDKTTHEDEEYFLVVVTPEETAGLSPGDWELAIDVSNEATTPPFSDEAPVQLKVDAQRIPDQTP